MINMLQEIIKGVRYGDTLKQGGKGKVNYTYIDFNEFLKVCKESSYDRDIREQLAISNITDRDIDMAKSLLWRLEKLLVMGNITEHDATSILGDFEVQDIVHLANKFKDLIKYLQLCIMKIYSAYVNPSTKPMYLICTFVALIPMCEKHIIWTEDGPMTQCNIEKIDETNRIHLNGLDLISFDSRDGFILHAFGEVKSSSTTPEELIRISGQFRYSKNCILNGREYFPIPYPKEILKEDLLEGKEEILVQETIGEELEVRTEDDSVTRKGGLFDDKLLF